MHRTTTEVTSWSYTSDQKSEMVDLRGNSVTMYSLGLKYPFGVVTKHRRKSEAKINEVKVGKLTGIYISSLREGPLVS